MFTRFILHDEAFTDMAKAKADCFGLGTEGKSQKRPRPSLFWPRDREQA